MDDISAGVVNDPGDREPAVGGPNGVSSDGVRKGKPERNEEHPGVEVHAPQNGTRDQYQGDGGKDELKVNHGGVGELAEERGLKQVMLRERDVDLAPDGDELVSEGEAVAPADPADQDAGEGV